MPFQAFFSSSSFQKNAHKNCKCEKKSQIFLLCRKKVACCCCVSVITSSSKRTTMMENIDAIDRLENHNRTYVPGASEENNNKFLGPDEIDLLVDAHRIEREEKEMREKYFRFLPPISSRRKELEEFSLAERFIGDVPHLFATKILTKLDDQDVAVFSRCSKRIRRLVRNEFGETKYAKLCVRKFASSKEGVAYAKWCGVPMTTRTFASIARVGNVEALGFALDAGWPHDAKAATACARGNHFETLRWMRANGLKWDKKKVLVVAMENRNVDMAEWIMMQEEEEEEEEVDD